MSQNKAYAGNIPRKNSYFSCGPGKTTTYNLNGYFSFLSYIKVLAPMQSFIQPFVLRVCLLMTISLKKNRKTKSKNFPFSKIIIKHDCHYLGLGTILIKKRIPEIFIMTHVFSSWSHYRAPCPEICDRSPFLEKREV